MRKIKQYLVNYYALKVPEVKAIKRVSIVKAEDETGAAKHVRKTEMKKGRHVEIISVKEMDHIVR